MEGLRDFLETKMAAVLRLRASNDAGRAFAEALERVSKSIDALLRCGVFDDLEAGSPFVASKNIHHGLHEALELLLRAVDHGIKVVGNDDELQEADVPGKLQDNLVVSIPSSLVVGDDDSFDESGTSERACQDQDELSGVAISFDGDCNDHKFELDVAGAARDQLVVQVGIQVQAEQLGDDISFDNDFDMELGEAEAAQDQSVSQANATATVKSTREAARRTTRWSFKSLLVMTFAVLVSVGTPPWSPQCRDVAIRSDTAIVIASSFTTPFFEPVSNEVAIRAGTAVELASAFTSPSFSTQSMEIARRGETQVERFHFQSTALVCRTAGAVDLASVFTTPFFAVQSTEIACRGDMQVECFQFQSTALVHQGSKEIELFQVWCDLVDRNPMTTVSTCGAFSPREDRSMVASMGASQDSLSGKRGVAVSSSAGIRAFRTRNIRRRGRPPQQRIRPSNASFWRIIARRCTRKFRRRRGRPPRQGIRVRKSVERFKGKYERCRLLCKRRGLYSHPFVLPFSTAGTAAIGKTAGDVWEKISGMKEDHGVDRSRSRSRSKLEFVRWSGKELAKSARRPRSGKRKVERCWSRWCRCWGTIR